MTASAPPPARRERLRSWVTRETTGGMLLLAAAAVALLWANSPAGGAYRALSEARVGPAALHLDLPLAAWAADGLLAVFFLVVGLELGHELAAGSLRRPREAAVPVLAAVGGMAVPAVVFVALVLLQGDPAALHGWAIPTATDIAFALAVLAVFGRGLPVALRTFLLTLAVVDDLLAIVVIAVFYSEGIELPWLLLALAAVAAFARVARARALRPWTLAVLVLLGLLAWVLMHASGVHATIAGVLLGLAVPARARHGEAEARAVRAERTLRPWSSGIVLPVFAFFAAGVPLAPEGGGGSVLGQPVVLAVAAGLVAGKLAGVLGTTALVTRATPLRLPDSIGLRDLLPVGLLTGMGFTVSLLVAELSFADELLADGARIGVLAGTLVSAALAAVLLRWDARKARRADMNEDGVPDPPGPAIGDEG